MLPHPIQIGKDVIDQLGRYVLTTFPVTDSGLQTQLREGHDNEPGTRERLAKGPYVFLNRPFVFRVGRGHAEAWALRPCPASGTLDSVKPPRPDPNP